MSRPEIETSEYAPIRCLLELRYDGTVSVLARRGCSERDIHDLLTQFAAAAWPDLPTGSLPLGTQP